MQAEQDKTRSERTHEEKSKLYQECEQQRVTLQRSLKRSISKSKYKIKKNKNIILKIKYRFFLDLILMQKKLQNMNYKYKNFVFISNVSFCFILRIKNFELKRYKKQLVKQKKCIVQH